jgi:hypothetical protein
MRNNIARLDAATGLADSFDPNADNIPLAIVVQADGKIVVGGQFTSIGGQARNKMARLDPTTGLADSFDPNVAGGGNIFSVAVQADSKILAGGFFHSIGGQMRNHMARVDANTGLVDSFDPNASSTVLAIVVQADGKILVGGHFTIIGGQTRNYIARLGPDTTSPTDFFRSTNAGAGQWNDPASWESSHDGSTGWFPATLTPTSTANTITILSGHTCNVTASVHADQLVIESGTGGIVVASGQTLTIDDGPGTDLTINGWRFALG